MSAWRLAIGRDVIRFLSTVDNRVFRQLMLRVVRLTQDPRPHDSEALKGFRDAQGRPGDRVDQGEYRILYTIDRQEAVVGVFRIGHREDVYRGLS